MKRLITGVLLGLSLATPLLAQESPRPTISPQVQRSTTEAKTLKAPQHYTFSYEAKRANTYPLRNLKQWIATEVRKGSAPALGITLGVRGDRVIRSVSKQIPNKAEGYYLNINERGITVAGHDERGLFYGLQTLRQLLSGEHLVCTTITDYPDVPYRGVVEGFYGTPWSYEDRLRQLDFYGRNKLNVYIYGPKDDPYHSVPSWRKPYPTEEAKQIQSLVKRAEDNGVIFYWAIHPGQDIKWNEEDRDTLLKKFEAMYNLGVRGFAVFFDDISGEGTRADKQAELLNHIDNHFIKAKGDIAPLIMCPTEYNKSWSNIEKGYLPTLGDKLNPGIEIMWTGNRVVATLDKPDIEWINKYIKRKAYVWFNFPVSDFVRNHLLLGETYGNSLEIGDMLSGFLSNPMEHAESSKIALYSVADYTWNMRAYDSKTSWKQAMREVFPEAPEALHTFAKHSSALGQNGHRFDREESVDLQAQLKRLSEGSASPADIKAILDECRAIRKATARLLASKSNPNMIDEMKPWLTMARLIAEYGEHILTITSEKTEHYIKDYEDARALQRLMYLVDIEQNQNPYQPGVRYGTQHLVPALNAHLARLTKLHNEARGTNLPLETSYKPFALTTDVSLLAHQPITTRGKQVNISPSNEVIKWEKGNSLTLTAVEPSEIKDLLVDLGTKEISDKISIEILVGNEWHRLTLTQKSGETLVRVTEGLSGRKLSALRLVYNGSDAMDLRLRRLAFSLQ